MKTETVSGKVIVLGLAAGVLFYLSIKSDMMLLLIVIIAVVVIFSAIRSRR